MVLSDLIFKIHSAVRGKRVRCTFYCPGFGDLCVQGVESDKKTFRVILKKGYAPIRISHLYDEFVKNGSIDGHLSFYAHGKELFLKDVININRTASVELDMFPKGAYEDVWYTLPTL